MSLALQAAKAARSRLRQEGFEALIEAIEAQDEAGAVSLIEQGAGLAGKGRPSALSAALRAGLPRAALACVRAGASLREAKGLGHRGSAYDFAVDEGVGRLFAERRGRGEEPLGPMDPAWRDLALGLLEAGADANEADSEGVSALITAAIFNQVELIEALLAKGARLEGADRYGNTALICAASAGSLGALEALIKAGASAGAKGFSGQNAVLRAMDMGGSREGWRQRCAARAMEAGCDPDEPDAKGRTARSLIERELALAERQGRGAGELRSALERWDVSRAAAGAKGARAKAKGL